MARIILVTTVALLGVGGWYASAHYSLEVHRTAEGAFQYVRIVPRTAKTATPAETPLDQPPAAPLKPTIRIATFNLDGLDDSRLSNPKVSEGLVRILSRFDVVALQNISTTNRGVLMRLKDLINATGRSYDFVTRSRSRRRRNWAPAGASCGSTTPSYSTRRPSKLTIRRSIRSRPRACSACNHWWPSSASADLHSKRRLLSRWSAWSSIRRAVQ